MIGGDAEEAEDGSLMSIKLLRCAAIIMGATQGFDRLNERGETTRVGDFAAGGGKQRIEIKGRRVANVDDRRRKRRIHRNSWIITLFSVLNAPVQLQLCAARQARDRVCCDGERGAANGEEEFNRQQ